MTRFSCCALLLFAAGGSFAAEESGQSAVADSLEELGRRYAAAVAANNPEAYKGLWYTPGQFRAFLDNPPEGVTVPPAKERPKLVEYFQEREKFNDDAFPKIVRTLRKYAADISALRIEKVVGKVRHKNGIEQCSMVTVRLLDPKSGTRFGLRIDDAHKMPDGWYFTDRQQMDVWVTKDGKLTIETAQ